MCCLLFLYVKLINTLNIARTKLEKKLHFEGAVSSSTRKNFPFARTRKHIFYLCVKPNTTKHFGQSEDFLAAFSIWLEVKWMPSNILNTEEGGEDFKSGLSVVSYF